MEKNKCKNKFSVAIVFSMLLFLSFSKNAYAIPASYQRCAPSVAGTDCTIGEFIYADDRSTPITTNDFCQIKITDPTDAVIANNVNMSDKDDGWYYYVLSPTPATEGIYRTVICCDTGANKKCVDKTFVVGTSFESLPAKIWAYTERTLTSFGTLVSDTASAVWTSVARTLTGKGLSGGENLATETAINSAVTTLQGASPIDLTTLAGYVDSVEGYIGTPSGGSPATLFGAAEAISTQLDQLDTLETKIDTVDTIIDLIRSSQLLGYNLQLSDAKEIQETKDYRAKLTILDYESDLVDAASTPTIVLYDALRATPTIPAMTKTSTGIYEFVYTVPNGAANGSWETVVTVDLGGSAPIELTDYWEVTGSPAQVIINSISDATVPTISGNITITNEGSVGYEYQYEYCVVSTESNQCGGEDDVAYAKAAKYINAGQNWQTDLSLTVSAIGNYWFKLVVYWGTENSGAAKTFAATEVPISPGGVGGSGGSYCDKCLEGIYGKLSEIQNEIGYHGSSTTDVGASVYQTLKALSANLKDIGGTKGYNLDALYNISNDTSNNLAYLKNKSLELAALLDVNKLLIDKVANQPIIKTWFEWNSVVLKMLVINPSSSQTQTVPFKAYLPRETKPEYIISQGDLLLDFDDQAGLWYVHKDIKLGPGQSVTKEVEIKDIWLIPQEDINSLRSQFNELIKPLQETSFFAQATTLKSDSDRLLDGVERKQNEYKATPQEHIIAYRENQESLKAVATNLDALKKLVTDKSNAGGALGQLFGVSTTMTWAIIFVVVVGVAVLMFFLYMFLSKKEAMDKFIVTPTSLVPPVEKQEKQDNEKPDNKL